MIKTFDCKWTESVFCGERVKKFPVEIQNTARRKLKMLNNSQCIADLKIPPSNRLEKLKGTDFYSIRINDQWRVLFRWIDNMAFNVRIIDYHK